MPGLAPAAVPQPTPTAQASRPSLDLDASGDVDFLDLATMLRRADAMARALESRLDHAALEHEVRRFIAAATGTPFIDRIDAPHRRPVPATSTLAAGVATAPTAPSSPTPAAPGTPLAATATSKSPAASAPDDRRTPQTRIATLGARGPPRIA